MSSRKNFIWVLAGIIIVVGIVSYILSSKGGDTAGRDVVVMNNGLTYFGHLSDTDKQFVTLRDVYYPKDPASVRNTNRDVKKTVSLFRYGDEVYAPESMMKINRDDILYYSTMQPNSKINEAIDRFVSEQSTDTSSPAPTESPAQ